MEIHITRSGAFQFILILGSIIRIALYKNYREKLQDLIFFTTPSISWRNLREISHLTRLMIPAYDFLDCAPVPIAVGIFNLFHQTGLDWLFYLLGDLLATFWLYKYLLSRESNDNSNSNLNEIIIKKKKPERGSSKEMKTEMQMKMEKNQQQKRIQKEKPLIISGFYYLNPIMIGGMAAGSLAGWQNALIIGSIYYTIFKRGGAIMSMLLLAMASYLAIYPICLIVPLILILRKKEKIMTLISIFILTIATLFLISHLWLSLMEGRGGMINQGLTRKENLKSFLKASKWLKNSLGCHLMISDLRPNFGLAWNLFTIMFDHFQNLFVGLYQMNIFIYIAPAAIKF